jgi:hypothetical protein
MADFNSSLPVRSEADGTDARVQVKVVDKTNPGSQQMTVDTDGNAHIEVHGDKPGGTVDVVLRLSELGAPNADGFYSGTDNTKPSSSGVIGHTRAATPADSDSIKKITAITSSTVHALDVSIHDESGNAYSNSNPLPVTFTASEGVETHDYKTATLAAAGADNHTYVVPSGATFLLQQVLASGSGKAKCQVQIGDGALVEAFSTKAVTYNSTAAPQSDVIWATPIPVIGTVNGTTIRIIMTNRDNQSQDVHSTIVGVTI